MSIDALRTPEERFANLPGWSFKPNYVDDLDGYEGLRMHFIDEGPRDAEVTMLCLHGQPSWSYVYRKMIPIFVSAGHRVIAPDHFGFGRSDKPVRDEDYGFHFHRNALKAFITKLDLRNVCLVLQDWGGILGLTLTMEIADRVTKMFIMNTSIPHGETPTAGFSEWRQWGRDHPDADVGTWIGSRTAHLSEAEVDAYRAPFPDVRYKGGVRMFPEIIMRPEPDGTFRPSAREGLETGLKARQWLSENWSGETVMAIGMADIVVTPERMEQLRQVIRGCENPLRVEGGGHFLQEWADAFARDGLRRLGLD